MTPLVRSARRGGLVVLAALVLVLSACSSEAGPVPGQAGADPDAVPTASVLDFSGPTLDGSTLDASTLAGTPVVLWFWAPWCTICRAEAPDVAEIATEYEGRVAVLGVPGRGEVEAMRAFVSETGTGAITHVADPDGALWNCFGVVSQPAYVFVDRSGTAESVAGSLGADQLRAAVAELA